MLKKYFIFFFFFTSFILLSGRASALFYWDQQAGNNCQLKFINATATNVISQNDLSGYIDVCVVTGAEPPYYAVVESFSFAGTTYINSNVGTTTIPVFFTFLVDAIGGERNLSLYLRKNTSTSTITYDTAEIRAKVPPVPIVLSNNRSLANNGTLISGQSITFTCTNSTELYYDPIPNATNTPIVSDYTGATGYTLVYQVTPSVGTHTIECDNIAGALTREIFTFNVVAPNKLDINNTSYTPTVALSPVDFTWSSNGTDCGFYNYDKSVKFGNATGNAGSGFSYTLGSPNYPSGANSYGYYIKCYDTANPGTAINELNANLSSTTEMVSGTSTTVAWYYLVASFSCPSGYSPDSGNNNICVVDTPPQNPPICAFTNPPTNSLIACSCPSGTITGLSVEDTNGDSQQIIPPGSSFAWSNLQYRYQITCSSGGGGGGGSTTLVPALERPYTHFLSFNVSAGYIKPGGVIDLNWVIQDPTTTCKIVGVDLKTGAEIFNSNSSNYSAIKTSVTVSKSSSSVRNFSDGSFKALMGQALTINGPTRFTASCQNNSSYKPGYYQLVRDVYTTASQER